MDGRLRRKGTVGCGGGRDTSRPYRGKGSVKHRFVDVSRAGLRFFFVLKNEKMQRLFSPFDEFAYFCRKICRQ